ncbi:MAG: phosphomannomutase [Fibrobacteres bacterium]|nr:phosphomannomutase [Fibrobacterota bacterium]
MATDGAGTANKAREAIVKARRDFARAWSEDAVSTLAALPGEWGAKVKACLEPRGERGPALWDAANTLGAACNDKPLPAALREACFGFIARIRDFMGRLARESGAATTVVFGTSGWREAIGEGFTVENVHKVVRGIIAMMKDPAFLNANGYDSFEKVKGAGILVLRDNRFMGDEFMACAMRELAAEGIRIHDAGECPTGVGSAVLTELKAAGSINFTPSHNPMEYAGIKFNPADGGPADVNLTSLIEKHANALMRPGVQFRRADADFRSLRTRVDAAAIFTAFVENKSKVFDLKALRAWLRGHAPELFIAIDNMHGSSRGYIQHLLGPDTLGALEAAQAIRFYNTEDDYSFHGVKPEPNAKNQAILIIELAKSGRPRTLAVALDPDADRIRFADKDLDIDMNRFGAIGYANLLKRGIKGGLATTVPSSGFASEIAKKQGMKVFETEVGFKNFRGPLSSGEAVMAFEESDGISFTGHTLEKCALAGFLSALSCLAAGGSLSEQYRELRREYGWFYPGKGGADVKGVSVEAWQRYKDAVMRALEGGMVKIGDKMEVGAARKEVARLNTADGLKIVFTDRSWMLLRPSGTEPKFRYYFEAVGEGELADAQALSEAYAKAAAALLDRARELAGPAE